MFMAALRIKQKDALSWRYDVFLERMLSVFTCDTNGFKQRLYGVDWL